MSFTFLEKKFKNKGNLYPHRRFDADFTYLAEDFYRDNTRKQRYELAILSFWSEILFAVYCCGIS